MVGQQQNSPVVADNYSEAGRSRFLHVIQVLLPYVTLVADSPIARDQ
jgi:hypothetical protein